MLGETVGETTDANLECVFLRFFGGAWPFDPPSPDSVYLVSLCELYLYNVVVVRTSRIAFDTCKDV